ncbi:MAG: DUF2283 domain-containing protein [bacterium]|nr:DUF2283 domain-containing protein [bacterium]
MKITYDKTADAMYIYFNKGRVSKTVQMKDSIVVDLDKKGKLVGIEILDVSSQIPERQIKSSIKTGIPVLV